LTNWLQARFGLSFWTYILNEKSRIGFGWLVLSDRILDLYPRSGAALVHGPGCGAAEPALAPRLEVAGTYGGSTAFHSVDCNGPRMFGRIWRLLRDSVQAFIADDALSRGASISTTSIGPVLFIVVAIAGLAFGEDAARGAIANQLSELMGRASADLVQPALQSRSGKSSGILASVVGATTLLITASGVFGEMQSALNAIWKAQPQGTTVSRWCGRARRALASWPRSASCCWSPW
jgi:hypothetical protein